MRHRFLDLLPGERIALAQQAVANLALDYVLEELKLQSVEIAISGSTAEVRDQGRFEVLTIDHIRQRLNKESVFDDSK